MQIYCECDKEFLNRDRTKSQLTNGIGAQKSNKAVLHNEPKKVRELRCFQQASFLVLVFLVQTNTHDEMYRSEESQSQTTEDSEQNIASQTNW